MGNTASCSVFRSAENEIAIDRYLLRSGAREFGFVLSVFDQHLEAKATKNDRAEQSTFAAVVRKTKLNPYTRIGKNLVMIMSKRAEIEHHMVTLIKILEGPTQIELLAAGICVLGHLLVEIEQICKNRKQYVQPLRSLCAIARRSIFIEQNVLSERESLNEAINFIFDGCILCLGKMKSRKLYRHFPVAVDLEEFQSKIQHSYPDLTSEVFLPKLEEYPDTVVIGINEARAEVIDTVVIGINEARAQVIELLDLESHSSRGVVLYGVGGIGKTTLATAVLSSIDLKVYKYCRVNFQQDCSDSEIKELQEQALNDLFAQKIKLRNYMEGKEHLLKLFREETSQPVFLFIDNVLRGSDLAKFLPENLCCLPNRSRILSTTRNFDETYIIEERGVWRCPHAVNSLSHAKSVQFLCWKALGATPEKVFDERLDIKGLVKKCGGLPLVLEMVGSNLRKLGNDFSTLEMRVNFFKDALHKEEGNLSEKVVDLVYNNLEEDLYKDAFLDIAVFFNNWEQRMVGYIVGEVALRAIKEAALVKITDEGKVIVHDIVQTRGRKLSEGDRITDHQSLEFALQDAKRLEKLKGIWLPPPDHSNEFRLQAEKMDLMNTSLRILHLGKRNMLHGESKGIFPNLRLLHIIGDLRMGLTEFDRLAVLQVDLTNYDRLSDPFDLYSLRMLNLTGSKLIFLPASIGLLSCLEEMNISKCEYLTTLPAGIGQLNSLKHLDMSECSNLDRLPDGFSQLKSLTHLQMSGCSHLRELPEKFGQLKSLEYLKMSGCSYLCKLPDGFGQLNSLKHLDMSECSNLEELPIIFGHLNSLMYLNISGCSKLVRLPRGFRELVCLTHLDMSWCSNLEELLPYEYGKLISITYLNVSGCSIPQRLPHGFHELKCLTHLHMSGCSNIKELPYEFGQFQNLIHLDMSGCSNLQRLPDGFHQLKFLTHLHVSGCSNLQELPNGFGQLKSLTHLHLSECSNLQELPNDFGKFQNLMHLDMSDCSNIQRLPNKFSQLKSLTHLHLSGCSNLQELPNDFGQLNSLTFLDMSGCSNLQELPNDFGQLNSLTFLDMSGCSNLQELPNNFGQLNSLTFLNMSWCSNLQELPNDFSQFQNLTHLDVSDSSNMQRLPDKFSQIKSLTHLHMSGCYNLQELPNDFGQLKSLTHLHLSGCSKLQELPNDFGQLKSLTHLHLSGCSKLQELPNDFGQLNSLIYLDISGCSNLKMVSDDFEQLSSVGAVDASYCLILDFKAMDKFVEMTSLIALNIQESPELVKRWRQVKEIYPLVVVDEVLPGCYHEHSLSSALFHEESKFLLNNGDSQVADSEASPGPGQLAFVLSMSDWSWPYSEMIKEIIAELSSQGFQIVYVCVGQKWEDTILHNSTHLPLGAGALIAPNEKWNILAGYSIFQLISEPCRPKVVPNLHIVIATACVSLDREGKRHVQDMKFKFSVSGDDKAFKDVRADLNMLFFPMRQLEEFVVSSAPEIAEVGIDEARGRVMKLLDLKDQSTRCVVLYGIGGIGKTALASAVFGSLELNAYKHCRIDIQQDCSEFHLKQLQEQVLKDLFREETCQPVFLFMDNALRERDLAKLLPGDLSCLPNGSRILITTRKLDETDMIEEGGLKRYAYNVNSLSEEESIKLLCAKALGTPENLFDKRMDIDGLVKLCGGVPLLLVMVGFRLRKLGNNVPAYKSTIEFLKNTLLKGEGELIEKVVDVVYNSLEEDLYKNAFLDIASFFNNWDERMVGYIVGEVALQALKEAALVNISQEGEVIIQDIVQARGRKLSEGNIITSHDSLRSALQDAQRLEKLKGIWLPPPDDSHGFQLEEKHLELMNRSLRVLHLGMGNRLDGESKETFPNLRLLDITGDFGVELTKLERLAVLRADLVNSERLPDSLHRLASLKMLKLSGSKLSYLPKSFGQLSRLEELDISQCEHLSGLPDGFGQLKFLRYLEMSGCSNVEMLSDDFEHLSSLCAVNASNCPKLHGIAVDKLVKMKSLLVLNIQESSMLTKRWGEVKEASVLIVQDGQRRLHEHPVSAALFHQESKFIHSVVDLQMPAEPWSPGHGQLAIVLSMRYLSGPSNCSALDVVNEKIRELALQKFQIVYVRVGQVWENLMQTTSHSFVGLPPGTHVWIPPHKKWSMLFGYSIFQLISPLEGETLVSSLHTLIASGCVSVDEEGRKYVKDIELMFPGSGNVEGLKDLDGGFSKLFSPIIQMDRKFGQV